MGRDIEIVFTGLRPGEKLFEELFLNGQSHKQTCHEKIFMAANGSHLTVGDLEAGLRSLQAAAARNDRQAIFYGLHKLVPEFGVMTPAPDATPAKFSFQPMVRFQGSNGATHLPHLKNY